MDSLVSRMHHLIAPVSVSLHFPRGLSKRDRRERLCFEGKKSGGGKGKYELDYDAEKESLSFFCDSCELRNLGKRKGGLFDEIDRFLRFETAMEIRNII